MKQFVSTINITFIAIKDFRNLFIKYRHFVKFLYSTFWFSKFRQIWAASRPKVTSVIHYIKKWRESTFYVLNGTVIIFRWNNKWHNCWQFVLKYNANICYQPWLNEVSTIKYFLWLWLLNMPSHGVWVQNLY